VEVEMEAEGDESVVPQPAKASKKRKAEA